MGSSIQDILRTVPEPILRRGEDYYEGESILSLTRSPDGVFSGKVSGSSGDTYKVQVKTASSNDVSGYSCTCPYDYGDVCKHIVAVMLAIEDGNFKNSKTGESKARKSNPKSADLQALLKDLPREKLQSIILSQAKEDAKFRTGLILELGTLDVASELSIVRDRIRHAIQANTRRGYIDDVDCDKVCDELYECLDLAKDRLGKGQFMVAFEISLCVLLTGADLSSSADSSSGSLMSVMEESFESVEAACRQIVKKVGDEDRKTCYEKLCREAVNKVLIGWISWSFDLLKIAALMATEENQAKIIESLGLLRDRRKDQCWSTYEQTEEDLVKLKMVQILKGKKAARAFIDSRLEVDWFRRLAVEEDLRKNNFANAEKLCRERIKPLGTGGHDRPSEWWYLLYKIYERTEDREKLLSTAKSLLLQGDLQYYKKLKGFYRETGGWDEAYPLLRAELKASLPGYLYTQILDWEDEHTLLLEEVKQHSEAVFQYGPKLAKYDPKTVYELYRLQISKAARESNNRNQYSKLCDSIHELYRAGGKEEALALAEEFIREYKRRTSMMDELEKLKRRLKKPPA